MLRARILRREPLPEGGDDGAGAPVSANIFDRSVEVHRLQHRLRSGAIPARDALAHLDRPDDHPELVTYERLVRAEALLLGGAAEEALAEAHVAVAAARDHGYGVLEAEARQLACDVLLHLGRDAALAEAAADLARHAGRMPSPRFCRAADFFVLVGACAAGTHADPATLEALAADSCAPDTALRARRLLGLEAAGDALDRAVVDAFVARTGWRPPPVVRASAPSPDDGRWTPGWGLDAARARVWLPDGRVLDLSRHPVQLGLLACLAARGGRATKEDLVLGVWEVREYHPLHHDNRLQAAIRKLRIQIEDDPSAPARVVTESEGYALGGVFRWVR